MNSDPSPNTIARRDGNIDYNEWENLGTEVPFAAAASGGDQPAGTSARQSSGNVDQQAASPTEQPGDHLSEEEKQQLRNNLRRTYASTLSIMLSAHFDTSGDFGDVELGGNSDFEMATLIALQSIVPEEHRLRRFQNFTEMKDNLRPLDDAVKILADAVSESQFADEAHSGDIFLRQKHIDYRAGRRDFIENNPVDERIVRAVWAMDLGFESSPEAKVLIADPDYLTYTYGQNIQKDLANHDGAISDDSSAHEQERSIRLTQLGEMLRSDIDNNALTVEGILKDPFQRKCRIENIRNVNFAPPASVKELWRLDTDFYSSPDFVQFLDKTRSENPDIFNVNMDEINQRVDRAIDRIRDEDFRTIDRAYESDCRSGDEALIRILTPILDMGDMAPKIMYSQDVRDGTGALYRNTTEEPNTIVYFENNCNRLGYAKPSNRSSFIAHEMWHTHQTYGQHIDPALRDQYARNNANYIAAAWDYDAFRTQLREAEAYAFQEAFQKKYNEIINSKKGALGLWNRLKKWAKSANT